MPQVQVPQATGEDFLQGWGNVVVVLVGFHLVALAYWVFRLATDPDDGWLGFGRSHTRKTEEDKE